MDDFFNPAPENVVPPPASVDPAADFLAGDIAAVANEAPEELTIDSDSPVDLAGEFAGIDGGAPEVMDEDAFRKIMGASSDDFNNDKQDPSQIYNSMALADERISQLSSESEKMKEWRKSNEKRIADVDAKEISDFDQWKATAKLETDEFYKTYSAENEKRKGQNRVASTSSIAPLNDSNKAWQQIGDFIDFNAQRQAKETNKDRMKSLLFKLKTTPPVKSI